MSDLGQPQPFITWHSCGITQLLIDLHPISATNRARNKERQAPVEIAQVEVPGSALFVHPPMYHQYVTGDISDRTNNSTTGDISLVEPIIRQLGRYSICM